MDQEFVTEFQLIKSEMVDQIPALNSLFEEFDLDCDVEDEFDAFQEEEGEEVFYVSFVEEIFDDQIEEFKSALQKLNLSYELMIGTSDQEGVSYQLERKLPHQSPQTFNCTNRGKIFFTLEELLHMENPQAELATLQPDFLDAYLEAKTQQ